MSTEITWQTDSTSPKNTERLAEKLGQNLRGGEVIELVSDLGGGKTTFVRGLARGIGSTDHVSSPTFKISNEYGNGNLNLIHFDFYRLGEAGLMNNELVETIGDPHTVVVVEWADVVRGVLPKERLTIVFAHSDEETRHLHFAYPDPLAYLMQGLV
jgi:tRNA threonylcarbamoyladenosine biosynthesis protein TsaE